MNHYALALLCPLVLAASLASASSVLFLDEHFPGSSDQFRAALQTQVSSRFSTRNVTGTNLASDLDTENGPGTVLVLPDARYFPADAIGPLLGFLKRGNHLVAVSGPAFSNIVVWRSGKWMGADELAEDLAGEPGESVVDFASQDISKWTRGTPSPVPSRYEIVPSGDHRVGAALHARIGRLDNWETFTSPALNSPFKDPKAATAFWAKGGPRTREMMIEWEENDGSRWIAKVTLGTQWKRYALNPGRFEYWHDNPSKGRGGPDDRLNLSNVRVIRFGLALSHTFEDRGVSHEFWVADVCSVNNTGADLDFRPPVLESLSPVYKTQQTHATTLVDVLTGGKRHIDTPLTASLPLPAGLGSDAVRPFRCAPVLKAFGSDGELRALAAQLYINNTGAYPDSIWGYVGFHQDYLGLNRDWTAPLVVSMLKRITRGVYLANAGSSQFGCFEGEESTVGAYVANATGSAVSAEADLAVSKDGTVVRSKTLSATVAPGDKLKLAGDPLVLPAGRYSAKVTLRVGKEVVDEIEHEFTVASIAKPSQADLVTARGGQFYLHGKPWTAVGVNYWPRYVSGRDNYNLYWGEPDDYFPQIVEQDLALAERLGMTMLSAWYMRPEQAGPLVDFLDRARRHNLKINLFMPGLAPLQQDFPLAEKMIKIARLADNPTVFAYDIGWEVKVGFRDARKPYDALWQKWVIDQYGSLDSAVTDWKFGPETVDGVIQGPSDEQVRKDGDWRIMVAAYRRFWDDEISERYSRIRAELRRLDRRHLMGVRSGCGGNGSAGTEVFLPFDLASGARHLDFISPEAYGLDTDGCVKGGLTSAYAQYVSTGKPVFWAEYGVSIWPKCGPEQMERQRAFTQGMLEMSARSGCVGSAGWWWPGGFRVGENSDFGYVNPDGTPRPAALEFARSTIPATPRPPADTFITVDRDQYVSGYVGVFQAHKNEYARLVEQGRTAAVRTPGTGTTSADTPLIAVGNVPYNGHNPLKYLNAEFDWIRINGRIVSNGDVIEVEAGQPLVVEASVGNTGEARWLSGTSKGSVCLVARIPGAQTQGRTDADTGFLGTARCRLNLDGVSRETTCEFRMCAADRAEFGEIIRVTLKPM